MMLVDTGALATRNVVVRSDVVAECDVGRGPASLADTDYECAHGRLKGDSCPSPLVSYSNGTTVQSWPSAFPCGCWPGETPNLMSIFQRKEPLMLTAAPVLPEPTDDDRVREAIEAAAAIPAPAKPKRRVTKLAHATTSPLLAKILSDIDAEIARLEAAKAALGA